MDASPSSSSVSRGAAAMSDCDIEKRLEEVFVHTLVNAEEEVLLFEDESQAIPHMKFYIRKKDANTSLTKLQSENPGEFLNFEVASFALSKILKLKLTDEQSDITFIPESRQIENAVIKRKNDGLDESFSGIPVFKSNTLVVSGEDYRDCRPVFFRMEDLRKAIAIAEDKKIFMPPIEHDHYEVVGLEEMINEMKDVTNTKWSNVMFVPPDDVDYDVDISGQSRDRLKVYNRGKRKVILGRS